MAWYDDLNQGLPLGGQAQPGSIDAYRAMQAQQKPVQGGPKSNVGADLLPGAGGIGGALAGAAGGAAIGSIVPGLGTVIGGLIGGVLGGAGGSAAGQFGKNIAIGEKDLGKDVGQEALLGGIFSAPPLRLARGLGAAGKAVAGAAGKGSAKQAFEKAFIGPTNALTTRTAGERATQGLMGQATGIRAGVNLKGMPLTPQKMQSLQKFTLDTIGVPKTSNAEMVFERAVNYADETGNAIGSIIKTIPANKVNIPSVAQSVNSKINSIIGVDAANNQVAKDISARLASAKTPEELWTLKRELDRNLINYGRNPQSTVPGAEEVARAATQELRKALSDAAPGLKALNGNYANAQDVIALSASATKTPQGFKIPGFQQTVGGASAQRIKAGAGAVGAATTNAIGKLPSFGSKVAGGAGGGIPPAGSVPPVPPVGPGAVGQVAGQYVRPSALYQAGGQFAFGSQNNQPTLDQALMQQSDSGQLGAQYAQDPTNPAFLGVDPAQFGYPEDQTTQASPYPRENLLYDVQRDPANADKYFAYYQQVQEIFGAPAAEKPLSAEASKVISNANSGLTSLAQLESIISSGGGKVPQGTLVPGRELFGNLGANALGTAQYDNASRNLSDVITRLRTGAALTQEEADFYNSQLPQAFDSPDVISQKLGVFRDLFNSVASRTGSAGNSLEEALMSQQGGF